MKSVFAKVVPGKTKLSVGFVSRRSSLLVVFCAPSVSYVMEYLPCGSSNLYSPVRGIEYTIAVAFGSSKLKALNFNAVVEHIPEILYLNNTFNKELPGMIF